MPTAERDSQATSSQSTKVRVAMIGAGGMANNVHYPSLASFDDVEIAAICDLDKGRLTTTADKYGVSARYDDYRAMIDGVAPDAVYAVGPPHHMYDIWVWCLQHGLNLFIEKPMAVTIHQARMLTELADSNGCVTQVGFQRRTSPIANELRDTCLQRGAITHAVFRLYKCQMSPDLTALSNMMNDGVHAIDTIRWLCGGEVVDISCATRSIGVPDINFIAATLQFDNGSVGTILNNWASGRRIMAVEIHAPGIWADIDLEGSARLYADGDNDGVEYDARKVAGSDEFYVFGGFREKNREFIDAVKGGAQPSSNFADAVKTMEVAERILAGSLLSERS